ncbi:acyl-CoA dehydrogenase [Lentzea guizhouensis]|uniref:Acyl-CoA dehydrogenase n=1 Tax=Lentzea guizhouensis TaxID=1586287 RepID=A0A1B2HTP7_9PSEU|nr:acyl-CoA dehydrogenase family protein [Lentzea guizhouensis]ANZ41068.1 acyl-CoA dehydrogenase [Lentzea guizhouensis]
MTPEQLALRDSVRALLTKHSNVRAAIEEPGGYDAALWAKLCGEVGIAGLAIPEEYGGLGVSLTETHVVLAELGRTLTPAPLLSSTLASQALLATGNEEACARFLPRIADGAVAALGWAWDEPDTGNRGSAAAGGTLDSVVRYVLDGDLAEILLVVANGTVHEVDPHHPGVTREHTPTMDPTRHLATIRLDNAQGQELGPWNPKIRDIALAALAAEQVGAAQRALELTVEHTKTRVQFGKPIGSFQALKHRMADLHALTETARSAAEAATDEVGAAVAKVYCSEAFQEIAAEMIQLHGGIAITWEHDAHLYFKRAHGSAQLFGSPQQHVTRLGRLRAASAGT